MWLSVPRTEIKFKTNLFETYCNFNYCAIVSLPLSAYVFNKSGNLKSIF